MQRLKNGGTALRAGIPTTSASVLIAGRPSQRGRGAPGSAGRSRTTSRTRRMEHGAAMGMGAAAMSAKLRMQSMSTLGISGS